MKIFLFVVATAILCSGAVGQNCPLNSLDCLKNGAGATCKVMSLGQSPQFMCGTCKDKGDGCGVVCDAKPDEQTGCAAKPVHCAATATGTGSIGIAAACGTSSVVGNPDALVQPEVISSSNGVLNVALSVQAATLNATAFSFTSRLYCYNGKCSAPGPTLLIKPGDKVTVTLTNNLPAESEHASQFVSNTLRLPNTINLHTHGLHIDPRIDNVMETIASGASKTYSYEIPSNHLGGTHWYHDHSHGPSTLHMLGGMVGTILVDDGKSISASYDAMQSSLLVLTHHPLCSCNPTNDPFAVRSIPKLMLQGGDDMALNFAQTTGYTETDIILTNGQYQPAKDLKPGEWHRFEIVAAVPDIFMEIEIRNAVAAGTNQCIMRVLGYDGVILRNGPRVVTEFHLVMAGRVSVAVMCPTAGTYYLQSNPQERAADFEALHLQNLLTLRISSAAGTPGTATTAPTWTSADVTYPYYMTDLQSVTANSVMESSVEQTGVTHPAGAWLGTGKNCSLQCGGRGGDCTVVDVNTYGECPHVAFNHHGIYRFATPVCSTVEWVMQGRGATAHPLHLHVHHFQIIKVVNAETGAAVDFSGWAEAGDWRDTWPAVNGKSVVRFKADSFTGPIMVHCHYLYHEDLGMMDRWWTGDYNSQSCAATSLSSNCDSFVPQEAFGSTLSASSYVNCSAVGSGLLPTSSASAVSPLLLAAAVASILTFML